MLFYTEHPHNEMRNRVRNTATKENLEYLTLSAHMPGTMRKKCIRGHKSCTQGVWNLEVQAEGVKSV